MIKKYFLYLLFFLCLEAFFLKVSVSYKFDDLNDYLSLLLSVSSMVFTLMGIWIAFLYPNALKRIATSKVEHADFTETLQETKRLEGLVASVFKSAFVVVVIMLFYLAKLVLGGFLSDAVTSYFKQLALGVVVMASLVQLESIFYVIYSNVMFLNELHHKREKREGDDDI